MVKKNKTIIVMLLSLPNKHIIEKYEINKNFKNCNIQYWNFLPLVKLDYYKKKKFLVKYKNFKFIYNFQTFYNLYKKLPKSFYYVNLVGNYFITSFLELFLKFKNGKKFSIDFGAFIEINLSKKIILNSINLIKKFGLIFFFKKFFFFLIGYVSTFINEKILKINPDYFFVSSEYSKKKIERTVNLEKIYKIDSEDMKKFKNSRIKKSKEIITFIDQGFDDNFDYSLRKFKNTKFDVNIYWKKINKFFILVNTIFPNHKIIIACHPRRNKNSIKKFTKKKFFSNKTFELVAKSKFVIAHYSQSINFAVLLKKPILLLDSCDFNAHTLVRSLAVKKFANLLGSKSINLENESGNKIVLEKKSFLRINSFKYKRFINTYIGFREKKNRGIWKTISKSL